ncbi:MAG: DUF6518 family protein [Chloroflexi bacterium]|nr:DUF6518 family protein [Chloroflexota bacterium]
METTRAKVDPRPLTRLAAAGALGIVAGVAAKLADESGIGWLSDLGTFGAIWVLVIIVIAWTAPTLVAATGRAALFFIGLSMAYYAVSSFVLGFPDTGLVVRWAGLAVTAVPIMAAATWWAAGRRGLLPAIVAALVAAVALFDGNVLPFWYAATGDPLPPEFPYRPVQAAVEIGTALVAVLLIPRERLTRAVALALVVPASFLVPELVNIAIRAVPG